MVNREPVIGRRDVNSQMEFDLLEDSTLVVRVGCCFSLFDQRSTELLNDIVFAIPNANVAVFDLRHLTTPSLMCYITAQPIC